jgi:uncharacterized membrane protein
MTGMRGQDQEHRQGPARRTVWLVVGVVVVIAAVLLLLFWMGGGSSGTGGLY